MAIKTEIILTAVLAWLLIPTGTPDDVITFWIINQVGAQQYVLLLIMVGILMWYYNVTPKKATRTMGAFISSNKKKIWGGRN